MIEVGTPVALSAQFLRDTGQQAGEAGQRRGVVEALNDLGSGTVLATVLWTHCTPQRRQDVNILNLTPTKRIGADSARSRPGFQTIHKGL